MSTNPDASTALEETDVSNKALIETPHDIKALQGLSLYARPLPLPLIQQQLGVSQN